MAPGRSAIRNVFLAATSLLVVSILLTYFIGLFAIQSNATVTHARSILHDLDQIISTLRDAETAQRGFLLTGDDHLLKPYQQALARVRLEEGQLRLFASSDELPATAVETILQMVHEKITELEQGVQVRRDSALEPALSLVRAEEGKATMDKLRDEVMRLSAGQKFQLDRAVQNATIADTWRTGIFALTLVLNLGFVVWAYRRVQREVHLREAAALEVGRQKELLGTILGSIDDAVIATDADGRLTFLNCEAERLTGWTGAQAAGQFFAAIFQIVDELSGQALANPVEEVLRQGSMIASPTQASLQTKHRSVVPIDLSAAPIRLPDSSVGGVVVVCRDITERRKSEEARARLAAIVESSGDAIISVDLDGLILSWNAGAQRTFQYRPEEAIGKVFTLLSPPELVDGEKEILKRIRAGLPAERFETVRLAKDGRRIPVSVTVSPVKNAAGMIIGASKIVRDITELVAARETLARGKEELERLVEARTAKLREMVSELQHISYSITHDMRAPLRAMGAFAQMLLEEISASGAAEQHQDYCRRILTAAGRLDTLIRDALSFTRAVLQDLPLEPIDLSHLIHGLIDTYPNLHPESADIHVEGNLPVVLGNESLLTQCFSNLLGNAVKFVDRGVRPKVRLWAEINGTSARISVQDNGIGIPKHAHSRLFGMFQKVSSDYEGTGIGLAIVRKVAQRMGGRVGFVSEPGRGSQFWVELQLAGHG